MMSKTGIASCALVLCLMALVFNNSSCLAQTHYTGQISVGAKAGCDLSRMFFNPSVKQNLKPGFECGVMFRYVEERHFGLLVELNFIQRGWEENFEGAPFKYSRTIDYRQIPVVAHIYYGRR
ncbi:MAG: PorT family protein, partial [Muribaculaceae bacterium]|nr:PorT family protein [Muribaculaceae bacterium]